MASEASERWTIDQFKKKNTKEKTHKFPIDDQSRSTNTQSIENNIVNFFLLSSLFHNVVYEWNLWISRSAMNQTVITLDHLCVWEPKFLFSFCLSRIIIKYNYVTNRKILWGRKLEREKVNTVIIQYFIRQMECDMVS